MWNKKLLNIIIFLSLSLISNSQEAVTEAKKTRLVSEIDSILQSQVDLDKIPGAVILVKKNDQVVCFKAYGYAQKYDYNHNLLDPPEMMTVDHLFDIASLTKVIGTTTSIMLLVDRGLISVEDPVCKYIKAFDTPDKRRITIRNLLTHTAGLYEWYPLYYRASNKEECFRLIADLPLQFPIGVRRRYSDLGFDLLGELIEIVSGQPMEQFMEQNIFQPLGMNHTDFNPLKTFGSVKIAATSPGNPWEKRMITDSTLGYKIKDIDPAEWNGWRNYVLRGEVNDGNAWYANGGVSGAAGLFSTAEDIQKVVDMLMNKGRSGSNQFISGKTIGIFLKKDRFRNGLGWMMDTKNSFMINAPAGSFGHSGFTGTSIAVIPRDRVSVILLINRQNIGLLKNGEYYNVNSVRRQVFRAVSKYLLNR
ncbi:MAG: serine hydrolase domain-containing protein [Bacteroidota bacterium]|nr:serine hydrolase domain-containing protein [Bacteroidota bacterium]